MGDAYANFLAAKQPRSKTLGFKANWIPDFLFDFQKELCEWAVGQGRGAIFADCGLGKTPLQLVWAENVVRKTNKSVLIFTPLAVAAQTVREGKKFGIDVFRTKNGEVTGGINVVNYHRLGYYNPKDFAGVVCDECFPPDTMIEVFRLDNTLTRKYIRDIRPGDRIPNASGVDCVKACAKRRIRGAVVLDVRGQEITCSENHPFLTVHGWKSARDLRAGDYLVETAKAMCLVRDRVHTVVRLTENEAFLRQVLLGEMADEHSRTQGQGPQSESSREESSFDVRVVARQLAGCLRAAGKDSRIESDEESTVCREDGSDEDEERYVKPGTTRTWRQWQGSDQTTAVVAQHSAGKLDHGVCCFDSWLSEGRLSVELQDRFGEPGNENRHRVGRSFPPQRETEVEGPQENQKVGFARVERVEVLELGHPRLDRWRDAEGHVYFYDIQATRHPSFSVRGILVHNSSVLKHADSKTRKALTRFLREVDYRLLCTATPAPNDYMELGTSAEALGVMGRNQMLGMFFTNDGETTSQWRLKGHAKKRFWQWVGTWARAIRKPSDLGYDDGKFQLPPLRVELHKVDSKVYDGFFPRLATTLAQQRAEKRASLEDRCRRVAEILPKDRPALVWVQLNREGDLLAEMIPGAVQVKGSDPDDQKEEYLNAFALGQIRVLVTKPKIAQFGLNYQVCADMSYFPEWSHESFYQAVRRCWRFGQENPVTVNLVYSEAEAKVVNGMLQKESLANEMYSGIIRNMAEVQQPQVAERNGHEEAIEVPAWLK